MSTDGFWTILNALATFFSELIDGKATLAAAVFLLLIWIVYRVGGKHIDELYEKFRHSRKRSSSTLMLKNKVDELSRLLAESQVQLMEKQQLLDEAKEITSRSLVIVDRYQQENMRLRIENSSLVRELYGKDRETLQAPDVSPDL